MLVKWLTTLLTWGDCANIKKSGEDVSGATTDLQDSYEVNRW